MFLFTFFFLFPFILSSDVPEYSPVSLEESAISFEEAVQKEHDAIVDASAQKNWQVVREQSLEFLRKYENSSIRKDVYYYLGVAYYHCEDFEYCDYYLTKYLKNTTAAIYFEEALLHKFWVAEEFRFGKKKRIFNWSKAPALLSAYEDALDIYNEVIAALPYSDLTAHALYGKAEVEAYLEDYKESIHTYQKITQKFSKHPLSIKAYIAIANLYLHRCTNEHLDPNFLTCAQNNYRKFCIDFPGEERIEEAKQLLDAVQEAFANNLYQTGRFYERTYKPEAACIYYRKILEQFPHTLSAKKCQKRLDAYS